MAIAIAAVLILIYRLVVCQFQSFITRASRRANGPAWFLFPAFVELNLYQSAFTN